MLGRCVYRVAAWETSPVENSTRPHYIGIRRPHARTDEELEVVDDDVLRPVRDHVILDRLQFAIRITVSSLPYYDIYCMLSTTVQYIPVYSPEEDLLASLAYSTLIYRIEIYRSTVPRISP